MTNKLLKYGFGLQVFGFILFLFLGIIFFYANRNGDITNTFFIIYIVYLIYLFITVIFYGKESKIFDKDFDENKELLTLRMNNALAFSVPPITFAITIFISFSFKNHPWLWLTGLILLIYGGIYFLANYYLRYKELEKIEIVKEMCRISELKKKRQPHNDKKTPQKMES